MQSGMCAICAVCCALVYAEMGYDATKDDEPVGEVMLRGPQQFTGYYKQVHGIAVLSNI